MSHSNYTNSSQFTKDGNNWSAEISDFGPTFEFKPVNVYAMDLGFVVFSERTGQAVSFEITETRTNEDGVVEWILEPTFFHKETMPRTKNLRIRLFND